MKDKLIRVLKTIDQIGGETRDLVFQQPATEEQVVEVEKRIDQKIPDEFREVLLKISSHCAFSWSLPEEFTLPDELRGIFCGNLHWDITYIGELSEIKQGWVEEVFPNSDDPYDAVWHNKFVFQEVGNGDFLSIDLSKNNYGKIVYLSHDDGEGHGCIMANGFQELLDNWVALGCVGAEDWQWMPFVKNKTEGIDPDCNNAMVWKRLIQLE